MLAYKVPVCKKTSEAQIMAILQTPLSFAKGC